MNSQRIVSFHLSSDIYDEFHLFMRQEQITRPAEAARALIHVALAVNPRAAAEMEARQRAFNEARQWAFTNLKMFYHEQAKILSWATK